MKLTGKNSLAIAALVIIFSSCETPRYAYSPNAHNVPLLSKQGDSKLSASYSTNMDITNNNDADGNGNYNRYDRNKSNGFDLQGAVAVTDHFAVQGNYFSRSERGSGDGYYSDSSVVHYKRKMGEFGAGYFTSINKKNRIYFSVFAGVGFGTLKMNEGGRDGNGIEYNRFYNSDIRKYYLEPAIIFRNSEVFAASLSTRFSVIDFKNVKTDFNLDEKRQYKLDSLDRYATVFLEPAFVNSFGFNKLPGLRIEYQLGFAIPLDFNSEPIMDFRPFNFSLGLTFDIGKLVKGPAKKD